MLKPCIAESVKETRRPALNEVDWIVVEMAKKDGPLSLNPDGLWARISRHVLGRPVPRRLANDGLEALRRFSVRAWYWNLIRASDVRLLIEAGYSDGQVTQVLAHVAGRRGYSPTVEEGAPS